MTHQKGRWKVRGLYPLMKTRAKIGGPKPMARVPLTIVASRGVEVPSKGSSPQIKTTGITSLATNMCLQKNIRG